MSGKRLHIDWANAEAVKYACMNFHYAKAIPAGKSVKFGVWEDDDFIGCLLFSRGASPKLTEKYGFSQRESCELTRVALKGHTTPVSRILSICLKKLKKFSPDMKLIVSFADAKQDHYGGIYQATNWIYVGKTEPQPSWIINNQKVHNKTANNRREVRLRPKGMTLEQALHSFVDPNAKKIMDVGKFKYLYPLCNDAKNAVSKLALPYPKADELVRGK